MYIEIHLNADELTDQDRAILLAIGNAGSVSREPSDTEPAPKKRAPRKPKAEEPQEEVVEEQDAAKVAKHNEEIEKPSEPEEPKADPKELINDAAERAVKLIRAGKRDEVKEILDSLGLEKVTALKDRPDQVQPFLDAIAKLEN